MATINNRALRSSTEYKVYDDEDPAVVFRQAALLGFVGGLRSMMPFALLAWVGDNEKKDAGSPLQLLDTPTGRAVTALAAFGEVVGDKLPFTPSRTKPGPLFGRIAIGALAGAALCWRKKQPMLQGALAGALGAAAGSFGGYTYRIFFANATGIPDIIWAILEDATALSLGVTAVSELE